VAIAIWKVHPPESARSGVSLVERSTIDFASLLGVAWPISLADGHGRLFSHYPINSLVHILTGILFGGFAADAI
jgi:hypothetical protein